MELQRRSEKIIIAGLHGGVSMKLKNILFVVSDIEKSKSFYEGLFGLRVITDFGENVIFHLSCVEENYTRFCNYAADLTGGKCAPQLTGKTFAPKTT